MASSDPKVSVCIVTYNHERFIEQCILSVLNQVADFNFEVIVGVDKSSDGTEEIVKSIATKFPGIVKPIFHKINVGPQHNYLAVHNAAKGQYIAHLDGDDYWLAGKLEYQTNILDKNPEVVQTWCCAKVVDKYGDEIGVFPSRLARFFYPVNITSGDIALSYALVGQHSTQMYRKKVKPIIDPDRPVLDFMFAYLIGRSGLTYYSKSIMSAYRVVTDSSLTTIEGRNRVTVDMLASDLEYISLNYPEHGNKAMANMKIRNFFSRLRGHNVELLRQLIMKNSSTKIRIIDLIKSGFWFFIQKIKY